MLSLKYQFVTPLTSLVVIKPDIVEDGDIKEADMFGRKIKVLSSGRQNEGSRLGVLLLVTVSLGWSKYSLG